MNAVRFRMGVWLLRPHIARVYQHYRAAEKRQDEAGNHIEAERCIYMAIGVSYALDRNASR